MMAVLGGFGVIEGLVALFSPRSRLPAAPDPGSVRRVAPTG
jgi:hypothetical protein